MPNLSQQILAAVAQQATEKNFSSFLNNSILSGGFDVGGSREGIPSLLGAFGLGGTESSSMEREPKPEENNKREMDFSGMFDSSNGSGLLGAAPSNPFGSLPPELNSNSNSQDGFKGKLTKF